MSDYRGKLRTLVAQLNKKTTAGEIVWESNPSGKAAITNLKSGHVEVKKDRDDAGQDAVRISIFDLNGDLKTTFDDTAIEEPANEFGDRRSYFPEMQDLLDAALRAARGEDAILNAVLNELDDDVPF